MNTTGAAYLQIFNQNKFIEDNSIFSLVVEPTGDSFDPTINRNTNFSGLYINPRLKLFDLNMIPINIGIYNFTGLGIGGANIGFFNVGNFTNQDYIKTGEYNAFNIGISNYSLNSLGTFNFGKNHTVLNSNNALNLGFSNVFSGANNTSLIGINNNVSTGTTVYVYGGNNILNNLLIGSILGRSNKVFTAGEVKNFGSYNDTRDSVNVNIFGDSNISSGSANIFNFGSSNIISNVNITGDSNAQTVGYFNNLNNSSNILVFGKTNNLDQINSSSIFGNNNVTISNTGLFVLGENNVSDKSFYIFVNGSDNKFNRSLEDNVYGGGNNLFSTNSNFILGEGNLLNLTALDTFGRNALTGITGLGAGQTPFTGVTGYRYNDAYQNLSGINYSGGQNNIFIGNNNLSSISDNINIFGSNNVVLGANTASIYGDNNYTEQSQNTYVFGDSNSVSGLINYVIGSNNIIRSGDYNNILIGIDHEFVGNDKVASVNIASVDTNIEVNPTTIKLTSTNRPTINDENIIITSDLNSYLTKNNGLSNSGIFTGGFIFQDQSYSNLPSRIYLDSFSYTGRSGINYNIQFTGFFPGDNINGVPESIFTLSNFNIFGTTSYSGQNISLIFGNHTIPQFDPTWLIVDNKSSGIYYKNDLYPMTEIPQTGWVVTGFRGYSGKNPVYPNLILSGNKGVSISINPRNTGLISSYDPTYGKIYIPFFY